MAYSPQRDWNLGFEIWNLPFGYWNLEFLILGFPFCLFEFGILRFGIYFSCIEKSKYKFVTNA